MLVHENAFASAMALVKHPWTLLDIVGRKQGFDSPRLQITQVVHY
jgi:hypothetical protein